jgi:hypothetical protein
MHARMQTLMAQHVFDVAQHMMAQHVFDVAQHMMAQHVFDVPVHCKLSPCPLPHLYAKDPAVNPLQSLPQLLLQLFCAGALELCCQGCQGGGRAAPPVGGKAAPPELRARVGGRRVHAC